MASINNGRGFYWSRHTDGDGKWNSRVGRREPEGPPGAELSALRQGIGREPGSVPAMWRYYIKTNDAGDWTPEFAAEHAALSLFAIHQQSQARPMHRKGVGLGTAVLALRQHGKGQDGDEAPGREGGGAPAAGRAGSGTADWDRLDPVDRRFSAAATSTDTAELVWHLRGLITQLRGIGQPLDYTKLFEDLRNWGIPEKAARVRRRWGMQYFTRSRPPADDTPDDESDPSTPEEF